MKLNGKPSTNTLNTLNTWLPNWLQPLVEGNEENNNLTTANDQSNDTHNTRPNESTATTIRNPTPLTTATTTVKSEHPPAPPRFNEPYFNIHEYRSPSLAAYILYLTVIYIHLPLSIFFDANSIYVLSCLIGFNNYIWALSVYSISVFVFWFIVLIADLHSYRQFWGMGRPPVYRAYKSNRLFNLTCSKSLQHFRFLWTIRKEACRVNTRDFWLECTHHLFNNYPIILTSIPRAAVSLAIVLQFWHPTFLPIPINAFFRRDAQLTSYAQGVLIAHVAWVGARTIVVVSAFLLYYFLSSSVFGTEMPSDDKEALRYAQLNNHSWAWKERLVERIEDVFRRGINPAAQEKRFSWSVRERPTTWTPNQVRLNDRQMLRRCSSHSDSVIVTSRSAPVVRITENSLVPTPVMTVDRRGSSATPSTSQGESVGEGETKVQAQDNSQSSSQTSHSGQSSSSSEQSHQSHQSQPQTPSQTPSTASAGLFSNASWHTPEREPTVYSRSRSSGTSPRIGQARDSTTSMSSVGAVVGGNGGGLPRDESYGTLPDVGLNVPPLPTSASAELATTQEGSSGSSHSNHQHQRTISRQSSIERDLIASESRDALGPIQSTSRILDDFSYTPERVGSHRSENSHETHPSNRADSGNHTDPSNSSSSGSSSDLSQRSGSGSSSSLSRMSSFFSRKLKKKRSSSQTVLARARGDDNNEYNVNQDGVETEDASPPPPYTPTVSHSESRSTIEHISPAPVQRESDRRRQSRQSQSQAQRHSHRQSAEPIGLGLREEGDADDEDGASEDADEEEGDADDIDWNALRIESKRRLQDEQEKMQRRD